MSEHQLHIAITDDASLDHPVAHHSGWLAMRYGPEFDGFATQWIRNEVSLEDIADPYRCQTRPEHWDGYCAPRFTRAMMRKICADTDRAPCGPLERTGPPRGRHRGDRDAIRPQRCLPNQDGHYRPGAFRWPWTEYTGRDTAQVNEFVRTVRWHYERKAESWTVLAADRGWRVKVIDVLPTPSPRKAPPHYNTLNEATLTSYQVTADGSGDAVAADRALRERVGAVGLHKVRVVHYDLGSEWPGVPELARRRAERYGIAFLLVTHDGGFLGMVENRQM